jgi:metallo-beta-lactamase family protein
MHDSGTVTFYGGAGGVTGSKHLLEVAGKRILLDCGTFQGLSDVRERNRSFPFPPESIDGVILSHAHIDHCGMLPLLVKRGFTGPIFATAATRDVAEHMLLDSAGVEEGDAAWRMSHKVGAPDEREPLFTKEDVPAVMAAFQEVPYVRQQNEWFPITPAIRLKLYDAGHILGSAVSVIEFDTPDGPRRLAYTGDVGTKGTPILFNPEVPAEEIGTVIMESTYGAREHTDLAVAEERLAAVLTAIIERKGKIIIPAFSLGRTQVLVYVLHRLTDAGKIPRVPIYVDSPLATEITEVFRRHTADFDQETIEDFGTGHTPLDFRNLIYTRSTEESKALNTTPGPFMVISGAGMMTAGRVVHHLRQTIADPKNAILITGYQAAGTLGRRLLEGTPQVEIYGDTFSVRAQIEVFNEFSAHADQAQLTEYVSQFKGVRQIILVHGEPEQADVFRDQLQKHNSVWQVQRPEEGETLTLL